MDGDAAALRDGVGCSAARPAFRHVYTRPGAADWRARHLAARVLGERSLVLPREEAVNGEELVRSGRHPGR